VSNAGQDISAFCSALLGGGDGTGDDRLSGYSVSVFSLPDRVTRWIPAEVPEAIASAVSELAGRQPSAVHAVYIGLGFVPNEIAKRKEAAKKGQRAEAGDIAGIPGLWADIDIAGHGHKKAGLPASVKSAMKILDACGVPPTLIVHTGNGIQAWWAFSEPLIFDNDNEKAAIAALARDWNLTLKIRAREAGGWEAGVDSVFDLTRLMRAVGTTNTKDADGQHGGPVEGHRPVRILRNNGYTYDPDDFRGFLADDMALASLTAVKAVSGADATTLPNVDLPAVWRRVRADMARDHNYMPQFVGLMIEAGHDKVEDTWHGRRPDLNGDQSAYDAALVRMLYDSGASPEQLVEAVMCRRLRSKDTDKVDPARRTDYVVRTVLNVTALAEKANAGRNELAGKLQALRDVPPVVVDASAVSVPVPAPAEPVAALEPAEAAPTLVVVTEPEPEPAQEATPEPAPVERNAASANVLEVLDLLLIPQKFRDIGVRTVGMEHRDYGENQKGRLIFDIPPGYQWPGSGPALYRPGKPLKAEWYRKDIFEVPKGYQTTLKRDAMIPSRHVGKNKEEWEAVIEELTGHWERDSSGADLATTVSDWLRNYLTSHAPTTVEFEAVDNKRAYMVDTGNWGANGTPRVWFLFSAFAEFVSAQPGGRNYAGRAARNLIDYLHVQELPRPRMTGPDGQKRRTNWFEIEPDQFGMDDWGLVLEIAQEHMTSGEERRMKAIQGGLA
jgi:hypothetical protein